MEALQSAEKALQSKPASAMPAQDSLRVSPPLPRCLVLAICKLGRPGKLLTEKRLLQKSNLLFLLTNLKLFIFKKIRNIIPSFDCGHL